MRHYIPIFCIKYKHLESSLILLKKVFRKVQIPEIPNFQFIGSYCILTQLRICSASTDSHFIFKEILSILLDQTDEFFWVGIWAIEVGEVKTFKNIHRKYLSKIDLGTYFLGS